MTPPSDQRPVVPDDWDRLDDDPTMPSPVTATTTEPAGDLEPDGGDAASHSVVVALLAASWADAVTVLALVTGCVGVLVLRGYNPTPAWLPWAAGAGLSWWLFAAGVLLLVRRATPGMLLAGLQFEEPIPPRRVAPILVAAVAGAMSLGLVAIIGGRRHGPLAIAAGCPISACSSLS